MKRRLTWRRLAWAGLFALALPCRAQTTVDLTELSLEALLGVELPARSASAEFVVSATAVESCVVGARGLAFGAYDPLSLAATDATSELVVTCTAGAHYEVGLSAGQGPGASAENRRMSRGEQTLVYSVYRDSAKSQPWGDRVGSNSLAGVGTGLAVSHPIYGRIPARQSVSSGSYVDVIVATIYY